MSKNPHLIFSSTERMYDVSEAIGESLKLTVILMTFSAQAEDAQKALGVLYDSLVDAYEKWKAANELVVDT